MTSVIIPTCAILIMAKWAAQMGLEWLNQSHVRAAAATVPAALSGTVSPETYAKSVSYTLAKSRFSVVHLTWTSLILALVLFSGILPWSFHFFPVGKWQC